MRRVRNDRGAGSRRCSDRRRHCVIIPAFMVGALAFVVMPVAWNQQHEVTQICVIIRRCADRKRLRKNLSTVVDVEGIGYLQARARAE